MSHPKIKTKQGNFVPPITMSSSIRNPYNVVQSKSIHSSLASLSKETEELRQSTVQIETKFHQLSQELSQRFRPKQKHLLEQIREARDLAGRSQQQSRSLTTEKGRLNDQLHEESQQLKDACEHETTLLQDEAEGKLQFSHEMFTLNYELYSMLKRQEEERLLGRLDAAMDLGVDICEYLNPACVSDEITQEDKTAFASLLAASQTYKDMCLNAKKWQASVLEMRTTVLKHQLHQSDCHLSQSKVRFRAVKRMEIFFVFTFVVFCDTL